MPLNDPSHLRARNPILFKPDPLAAFTIVVSSGVTSSGLTQSPTVFEEVLSGGIALSNTVGSGGQVTVDSGGFTSADMVLSQGTEVVSAGGVASGVTVSAGGLIIGAGKIDSGSIYGFAANLQVGPTHDLESFVEVYSGGVASSLSVLSAAVIDVDSSGTAMATTVQDGGFLVTLSAGNASGSIISNGGGLYVEGEADNSQLLSGAFAYVEAQTTGYQATLSGAVVSSGAFLEVASSGVAEGVKLYKGATGQLDSGGVLASSTVFGGVLSDGFGGEVETVTVAAGGNLILARNAYATGVNVLSGSLSVDPFAVVVGLGVSAGGALIDNGFVEVGQTFDSKSQETLAGQLSGTGELIQASGGVLELDGTASAFTGQLLIGGGIVEVASTAGLVHGRVYFDQTVASGTFCTLQIDAANQPAGGALYGATLSDFNTAANRVDLTGVAFATGATAVAHGDILKVVDGAYTLSFTLADSEAKHYVVATDGHGGTLIHAAVGAGTVGLVHAAAAFAAAPEGAGLLSAHALQSARVELAADAGEGAVRRPLA